MTRAVLKYGVLATVGCLVIVDFVKQTIESFDPHPDIIDTQELYEEIVDVALGREIFLSHPNTVRRFRNVLPSPNLIVR